ncbi:MAG: sigma-54 dependent transcriptional regulator, partial [Myxococcota bacterium]
PRGWPPWHAGPHGLPDEMDGLVARSASMRSAVRLARRVAKVDSTVLVTGESGTGKEQLARLIHRRSARAARPFVAVNCGALTESLLESELFGHKKGAFTGATQDRIGLFESANGGTLLLDEVGEVSPTMQVKLLRVLQEGRVRRVGENRERPVDVRVLAATHRDLKAAMHDGTIRSDFYYRLKVVELRLAPLRERRDDLLPLSQRFLADTVERLGRPEVVGFDREALRRIFAYSWPGNVRELRNAIERAVALAEGHHIACDDLPPEVCHTEALPPTAPSEPWPSQPGDDERPSSLSLEEVERQHILQVLQAHDGHRNRAADALGIGVATLFRRLKRYRDQGFEV